MKRNFPLLAAVAACALVLLAVSHAGAAALDAEVTAAMTRLKAVKADADLLVLTDAPFVRPGARSALPELAVVEKLTGCTVGGGNLLFFQRPQNHPLRFLLFARKTGDAVVISAAAGQYVAEKINMSATAIADKAFWDQSQQFAAGKDMFTLAGIANAWAAGAPYDFLKCAELHNHICPGLTSGYLLAHYLLEKHPLAEGERYTVVSCPVWCKEDALQVILDATPGKKAMVVKPLSDEQKARIKTENPAGMVLIWNVKEKTGRGLALSFDMEAFNALSPKDAPKAATVVAAIPYFGDPARFVATSAEFPLTEALYKKILAIDTNPYEVTGLVR
jgi:formylmethanofuran dehydrogenase subunit E-like metal-binding protein